MNIKDILDGSSSVLERFKDSAPGSYRHCMSVSQLCEPITRELECDEDSTIAAAMLHDIGKCNNPEFFSENQQDGKNVHDELEPPVSYQYISRHISDSVLRLTQLGIDPKIIMIVSEHHGDSIVKAIYLKAKEMYNGSTVDDHYRYKSSKPTCIESCVLMICDVVESACKAMYNNGKLEDSKKVIDKLVESMILDEQLDILTIGHIRVIKKILCREIEAIYHKRITYPDDELDVDDE